MSSTVAAMSAVKFRGWWGVSNVRSWTGHRLQVAKIFCLCRADDVQLEFVMLDPYVRTNLVHDNQVTSLGGWVPLNL